MMLDQRSASTYEFRMIGHSSQIAVFAVAALATCCFVSFAWGIRRFFQPPTQRTLGTFFVTQVGSACAVLHLALLYGMGARLSLGTMIGAAAMYAVSLLLFWASIRANRTRPLTFAYEKDVPVHLVVHGPYRFIRHPFYAAYMLSWFAGPLALHMPVLVLTSLTMSITYVVSALGEERKFASSELAGAYAAYQRTTGMFLPRWYGLKQAVSNP